MLGSAHVVVGLSCCGSVTSEVVGSGWTQVTFLRTVGVGSPGLASLTPLSGGGGGPSRILFFVILSPVLPLKWADCGTGGTEARLIVLEARGLCYLYSCQTSYQSE